MKKFILITFICFFFGISYSQKVLISTSIGNITIKLYDDTPFHKENFLKLIKQNFYDSLLFHRVIKDFMIQTGDPHSKYAKPGQFLGTGGVNYTIPQEFRKDFYHKKGAVAAARLPDNINPTKESSGSQFYIVTGRIFTDKELDSMEASQNHIKFTDEQRIAYTSIGGAPHLDYAYTVFGEAIEGFNVLDKMMLLQTDKNNRPLSDVRIKRIYIVK